MYEDEKTDVLMYHCERIGVEPDLYLELIHQKYASLKDYREHIEELEHIINKSWSD